MILRYRIFPRIGFGDSLGSVRRLVWKSSTRSSCPQAVYIVALVAFSYHTVLLKGDRLHSSMLYPSGRTSCSDIRGKHRYRQGGRLENGPFPQQGSSEIDSIYGFDHNFACLQSPVRWSSKSCRWKLSQFAHGAVAVLALALIRGGPLGVLAQSTEDDADGDGESSDTPVWQSIGSYVVIVVLVAASGLFSGLTLGLLGLDKIGLEIISNGDEPRMAAFAKVGRRKTQ